MHCYNFSETYLPAGNDCVGSILFETHNGFQKQSRYFPEVLIKVFGFFFLFPRRSSVEKGKPFSLGFPYGMEQKERVLKNPQNQDKR